jgi:3-oxoacyl-[acyl-carrier protein] reductase
MRFQDKVAVVTGGAKGFGGMLAKRLAAEGAKVLAVDVLEPDWSCENVEFYKLNITDSDACQAFYDYAIQKYKHIDILINNAGITRDAMTRKMTNEQWHLVLDVNLTGAFYMTRLIGPQMEQLETGAILNVSSDMGEFGNIGQANYSASKAGMIGLTKTWAKEFARKGAAVRVNAVTPGYIMTDIIKTVPEELLNDFCSRTMLKRLGRPEEVVDVILFLVSDEASYLTSVILPIDGGLRM